VPFREQTPHEHDRNDRVRNSDDLHVWRLARDVGLGVDTMGKTPETQNHAFNPIAAGLHSYDHLRNVGGLVSGVRSPSPQPALCDLLSLVVEHGSVWSVDFVCGNFV